MAEAREHRIGAAANARSPLSERDRVGDYVTRALPRAIAKGGCDWPVHVEFDDTGVRARLPAASS